MAKLPREYLVDKIPRPGQTYKRITLSYLVGRKDVALLPRWSSRIKRGDCGLADELESIHPAEGVMFNSETNSRGDE